MSNKTEAGSSLEYNFQYSEKILAKITPQLNICFSVSV